MRDAAYALSLAPTAGRVPTEPPPRGLPVAVAAAVTEFLTGALLDNPHRVGKPLARVPSWARDDAPVKVVSVVGLAFLLLLAGLGIDSAGSATRCSG